MVGPGRTIGARATAAVVVVVSTGELTGRSPAFSPLDLHMRVVEAPLCNCNKNGGTPLAKCSGQESGKARDAGRCERTLGQPSCEAIKVEGRGGRYVLQACLGQPTVAGLA